MPMFFLGLNGAVRRAYTFSAESGFAPLFLLSAIGSVILAAGFAVFCYNIYWSIRYADRNISSDPWDARTLEWATASPVQHYNFAKLPEVKSLDAFWYMKKNNEGLALKDEEIEEIHMPSNSGLPFLMCVAFGIVGFFLIFEWHLLAAISAVLIIAGLIYRSFDYNDGYHIHKDEIKKTEGAWRKMEGKVNNHVS
jgi:cytochrome aa3-600 menaquinol oxidase subunit 1